MTCSSELWLTHHGRYWCLVKSQGEYSFGIFKHDSFRVVSGYRPNMGYLRLTAGLMFPSCGNPVIGCQKVPGTFLLRVYTHTVQKFTSRRYTRTSSFTVYV